MTKFQIGDKVRVLRKAKTRENNWENSWESVPMDKAVGQIGTVVNSGSGLRHNIGLRFDIPELKHYYAFPDFVLELVKFKYSKVSDVQIGDRVLLHYSSYWDGPATVTEFKNIGGTEYVYVKPDHSSYSGGFYFHQLEFLSRPGQTPITEVKLKQAGIARAVAGHSEVFAKASEIAVSLAKTGVTRVVNADMVQSELAKQGYSSTDLGNAAGALFRSKNWKKFGTVKSARQGNHAREISTWEYIGG